MKTAFVFTVAALGFAASVAWAGPAPAQPVAPRQATPPAVTAPAQAPSATPTSNPGTAPRQLPKVLCACTGGDHFA